ncbi:ATP-grasp domain-containing protein [Clostridium sp.]|uniref:ATP-grasp domain-containing protein n=1 Tax=Clostridium sp. TaxID=1506 RepID=UPI003F4077D1
MKIAIINHFSPLRVNYEKALKEKKLDIHFFTKEKFRKDFSLMYDKVYSYENLDFDGNLISDIIIEHEKEKFEAIVATYEYDIERIGVLRDYLKINGQNGKSSFQFRDKYLMKDALKDSIKVPKFEKVNSVLDIEDFIKKNDFPVVIKPRLGAGSIGVKVVRCREELRNYYKNNNIYNLMIEEFVDGEMYHVDGLYKSGCILLSVPSKYINTCLSFEQGKYLGSYMLEKSNPKYDKLNEKVKIVLDSIETPKHAIAFHVEFFIDSNGEVVLCEIASRIGGGMIQEAIEYSYNIDLLSESIKGQIFLSSELEVDYKKMKYSGWVIIPPKKGTLKDIQIANFDWIKDVYFKEEDINKYFEGADCSVASIVSYVVSGDNQDEIINRISELVEWQNNNTVWEN